MQGWKWTAAVLALCAWLGTGVSEADLQPRIVNGVLTSDYPATGALLYNFGVPATPTSSFLLCSGTLIGCQTFLTAAHCVAGDPTPANFLVFLQHAGFFQVAAIEVHPSYPTSDATGDVAVLRLVAPGVTGIAPLPLNDGSEVPAGSAATIVGFGRTGGFVSDYGLKRAGSVTTATCGFASDNDTSLCWNFEDPIGPPGSDSNTCNGDSGGPLFVNGTCGRVLAGVTSSGINATCMPDDLSIDASVLAHLEFIESAAEGDLGSATCGSISQVGDTNTVVNAFSGTISEGTPQAFHSFVVPAGIAELRVTMNAVDDGSDFDLYLKQGSPPTPVDFDCAHAGGNQFGACEITNPDADTWHVMVNRFSGHGTYQVTATAFTATPGSFPNDGVACDDTNECTDPDACDAYTCVGANVADGSACDDGSICTSLDECQSGACVGDPSPRMTCEQPPGKSVLIVKNKTSNSKDKVIWKFLKGPATSIADFDDPTDGSPDYTLCVYDESGGVASLAFDATAPGGGICKGGKPCWTPPGGAPNGYKYSDKLLSPDGILKMTLRAGSEGRSKIILTGKGFRLGLPEPAGMGKFFHQDSAVTVQLVQEDGDCWGTSFSSAIKNAEDQFKAKCGGSSPPCF